ncbi:hypothetical protein DICSQDRAFT_169995 [Dichomitus squalens LYAD-421 SS1]|uniref:Uncharacterized protein n=1 Tax=Dichomitus squalens (strain LYAD-421) TaxID=732165 RepID=R7SZF9_DICSQ|nr:uncharacterized protein DICSQDRAFT_169995 [Dichomitus squalens LYAD-421 SS1]EJF61579.1 hypothetical protein DICSQDRAFT_169995 [Dichomitus squalens LYAD-421 SS1]
MPTKPVTKSSRVAKAKSPEKKAPDPQFGPSLIYTQDDLENDMSNEYTEAWLCRSSEHKLYSLFNLILSLHSLNLRHRNDYRVSLISCPQTLFGAIPPIGVSEEEDSNLLQQAEEKAKAKSDNGSEQEEQSMGDLPPERCPDFARFVIFSDKEELLSRSGLSATREIVDFYELKALNCPQKWWTEEARIAAEAIMMATITQVYETAMAAFAYNPDWKQLFGVIVVGAYFTQVVWKKRPSDDVLRPIFDTEVPETVKKGVSYRELIGKLLNQIPQYEERVLPEILYWNAPVFNYHRVEDSCDDPRVSLTLQFLWAMGSPIKTNFSQLVPRSGLFEMPAKKPSISWGTRSQAEDAFNNILKIIPICSLKEKARSLGHRFDGDPEPASPTSTPPNSVADERYKASFRNTNNLPPRHIRTRLWQAQLIEADSDNVEDASAA